MKVSGGAEEERNDQRGKTCACGAARRVEKAVRLEALDAARADIPNRFPKSSDR